MSDLISRKALLQKLEEYSNLKYYICDDCWNDLIEFFDSEEEVEEE